MDKKELAELIKKLEGMKTAMALMQIEIAELTSRLRFIPVSEASSSSSDEDVEEYRGGMKP